MFFHRSPASLRIVTVRCLLSTALAATGDIFDLLYEPVEDIFEQESNGV